MKDYLSYTVEDFVTDESYLRYYFKENEVDIKFWTEWIGLHPEKLDVVISANNYIDALSVRLPEAEFQKEQQRFAQTLNDLSLITDPIRDYPLRKPKRRLITATILTAIIAGSITYIALRKNNPTPAAGELANVTMVEKYVPKGERAKITLPDGSEVELNADSKLTYPSKFTGASRELKLTGEAFFRVRRDSLRPFHVISGKLAIVVLGTSFNMQCYPDKDQVKVALVTGKVRLDASTDKQTSGETLTLTPAEMGIFDKHNLSLKKTSFNIEEATGWRQGMVVFNNADFNEIADRLDKLYNIKLINKSSKTTFRFKGTFTNTSPDEIVKSICLSKKLSYGINGNVITIH